MVRHSGRRGRFVRPCGSGPHRFDRNIPEAANGGTYVIGKRVFISVVPVVSALLGFLLLPGKTGEETETTDLQKYATYQQCFRIGGRDSKAVYL